MAELETQYPERTGFGAIWRNVQQPFIGSVVTGGNLLIPGESFMERRTRELRSQGMDWWKAAGQAWQENQLPSAKIPKSWISAIATRGTEPPENMPQLSVGWKGAAELAFDPLNLVPGIGVVPYRQLARGAAQVGKGVAKAAPEIGRAAQAAAEAGRPTFAPSLGIKAGGKKPIVPKVGKIVPETSIREPWQMTRRQKDYPDLIKQPQAKPIITPGEMKPALTKGVVEPVVPTIPAGWRIEIGKVRVKPGMEDVVTGKAATDFLSKTIIVSDAKYLRDPAVMNEEIAHILFEELPDNIRQAAIRDFEKAAKYKPIEVRSEFARREGFGQTYGQYLIDPSSVEPEIAAVFRKYFPQGLEPAIPAGQARPVPPEITPKVSEVPTVGKPVAGGVPPEPPRPPTAVGAMPEPTPEQMKQTLKDLFTGKESVAARDLTMQARKVQHAERIDAWDVLRKQYEDLGMSYEEAGRKATGALKGSYETVRPASAIITQKVKDYAWDITKPIMEAEPNKWERLNLQEALTRAFETGSVARKRGIVWSAEGKAVIGESQYSRLQRLLGEEPELLALLDSKVPLETAIQHKLLKTKGLFTEPTPPPFPDFPSTVIRGAPRLGEVAGQTPTTLPFKTGTLAQRERELEALRVELAPESGVRGRGQYSAIDTGQLRLGEQAEQIPSIRTDFGPSAALPEPPRTFEAQLGRQMELDRLKLDTWSSENQGWLFKDIGYEPPVTKVLGEPAMWPVESHIVVKILKESGMTVVDIGNFLRANKASGDLSFWRQVAPLTANNKMAFIKGNIAGVKAIRNGKHVEDVMRNIVNDTELYRIYEQGVDFLRPVFGTEEFGYLTKKRIIPRITASLPWVKLSNRGFVAATNTMLWDIFKGHYRDMLALNQKITAGAVKMPRGGFDVAKEMVDYSKMLADLSGRARIGKVSAAAPAMSAVAFAPRMSLARILTPRHLWNANPIVRKEAWKNLATFVGSLGAIIMAGRQMGLWEVELDPRSSNAYKMRVGKVWVDSWGGYQQLVRVVAQGTTWRKKNSRGQIEAVTPLEVFTRFARQKGSPLVGVGGEVFSGKTYAGKPIDPTDAKFWIEHISPMAWQDAFDAFEIQGTRAGLGAGAASFVGIGAMTYEPQYNEWLRNYPEAQRLGIPYGPVSDNIGTRQLTSDERAQLQARTNELAEVGVRVELATKWYQNATDENRKIQLGLVINSAREQARDEFEGANLDKSRPVTPSRITPSRKSRFLKEPMGVK